MPRHEQPAHTQQRREILHHLTLMERAAREARECLSLGDELAESARAPKLLVGLRLADANGANPQAEMQQQAGQLLQASIAQVNDMLALGMKLAKVLNAEKSPPPEANGTPSPITE